MNKTDFAELKEKLFKKSYTQTTAIISELIEIIKLQSEALEAYHDLHYAPKLDEALSETTTRLQKLRDGK